MSGFHGLFEHKTSRPFLFRGKEWFGDPQRLLLVILKKLTAGAFLDEMPGKGAA